MSNERIVHVVEDDAAVRRSLERLLGSAGLTPVLYESAVSFLARHKARHKDCHWDVFCWMSGCRTWMASSSRPGLIALALRCR